MSAANIAYLVLVVSAYVVFMFVLGAHWLRAALEDARPRKAAADLPAPARAEAPAPRRKAA